jgi:XisI protein
MDRINQYKMTVKNILENLAKRVPNNRPTLSNHLIINNIQSEFILILNGWYNNKHYYNVVAHVEVTDSKILIHEESIDPTLYERLIDQNIPESDIIPVYLEKMELV